MKLRQYTDSELIPAHGDGGRRYFPRLKITLKPTFSGLMYNELKELIEELQELEKKMVVEMERYKKL